MVKTNNTSNKLTNLELSIQLSLSGLSFCILNRNSNTITKISRVSFEKRLNPLEVLDALKTSFSNAGVLNSSYDSVTIIHDNDLSTLVPEAFFNENHLADYLKFNSKILKSDFIAYDRISENSSVNVYVPYININNYIYDTFGAFTFKHISTILIESILQAEKDSSTTRFYVHVGLNHFEIISTNLGKLALYNTFIYHSKEDFIYYVLFAIEQLKLDPETLDVVLIGAISEHDDLYKMAYKYIRNISFGARKDPYSYINKPASDHADFTLLKSF